MIADHYRSPNPNHNPNPNPYPNPSAVICGVEADQAQMICGHG